MSTPELKQAYWRFVELEKSQKRQKHQECQEQRDLLELFLLWVKKIFKKKR